MGDVVCDVKCWCVSFMPFIVSLMLYNVLPDEWGHSRSPDTNEMSEKLSNFQN